MRPTVWSRTVCLAAALVIGATAFPDPAAAQERVLPSYLKDSGGGIPTSLFGTYVSRGQLLLYPFLAYSLDRNREYQPAALGYGLHQDFRGRFRSVEGQIFMAYGVTDWLAVELEGGVVSASLDKARGDPSAVPARIRESGFADLEGQLRFRLLSEGPHRPELFGFLELTPATQRHKVLISEPRWDLQPGFGMIRGWNWGTLALRVTGEYNWEGKNLDLGEVAIEYLKRLSPSLRVNIGLEGGEGGAPDEFDLVAGVHWRLTNSLAFKFDNALGISSKATDWAPQLGLMVSLPR
jgi:hypothetical protein